MKTRKFNIEDYDKMKNLTLKVTPEFHQMLKRYAFENDVSMAYVIEKATKSYINKMEE